MSKRKLDQARGEDFFDGESSIYVSRVYESFDIPQHAHDFVEINFVVEGKGYHYIEDEVIPVQKGDVFLLPVGTSHVFRPSSPDLHGHFVIYNCLFRSDLPVQWQSVLSLPGEMLDLLTGRSASGKPWHQFKDRNGELERIFELMYQEYVRRAQGYRVFLYTLLIQLVTLLYRYPHFPHAPSIFPSKLEQAFLYIETHYQERITLQQLASAANLSKSQFQRLFKQAFGRTFMAYLHRLRIEHSCRLLRTTALDVQHIANLVGYEDMKFFHALFKRKTGTTPQRYRAAQKQANSVPCEQ